MTDIQVTDNPAQSRYEARVDGEDQVAGFLAYVPGDGRVEFPHTVVDPAYGGRGVASALARHAFDDVRTKGGLKVVPTCSFVRGWVAKHPEAADLVDDSAR